MKHQMSLSGLIGYLQGKGLKINAKKNPDSEDEVFEVEADVEDDEDEEETMKNSSQFDVTSEELIALRDFARTLVQNGASPDYDVTDDQLMALKEFSQLLVENRKVFNPKAFLNAMETLPAAATLVRNAQDAQRREIDTLIASIKANSANIYSDEELKALPLPVLNKLNLQLEANYSALGGAVSVFENEADPPLPLRPILLASQFKED